VFRRLRVLVLVPVAVLLAALAPTSSASASVGGLLPVLDCVSYSAATDTVTGYFGYTNLTSSTITVPIGSENFFTTAPIDRGQPTLFLPGAAHQVFSVTYPIDGSATWHLGGTEVTSVYTPANLCPGTGTPPAMADSSLAMPVVLDTTAGSATYLTSTVTDPVGPFRNSLGTVVYALPAGVTAGPFLPDDPCSVDTTHPLLVSCTVGTATDQRVLVRSATPGAYPLVGTFLPLVTGENAPLDNVGTTVLRVTGAPVATTGPASSITADGVVLNGTVDPAGAATTAAFRYWPHGHTDQAADAPTADPGSGFAAVPVTATVTGLQPGTTYDYALAATNADDTSTGATGSFTTPATPPPATSADLSVTMTSSGTGRVGQATTFTATVLNAGPDAADGVVLTLLTSTATTTRWMTATQGSCSTATPGCVLGSLPAGAGVRVVGSFVPKIAGPLALVASVGSTTADPAPRNDTAVRALLVAKR